LQIADLNGLIFLFFAELPDLILNSFRRLGILFEGHQTIPLLFDSWCILMRPMLGVCLTLAKKGEK